MGIGGEMDYLSSITWMNDFFSQEQNISKIHKTEKKKIMLIKFIYDKLNCQVSTIFMNPRSIHEENPENDSLTLFSEGKNASNGMQFYPLKIG
jgi:hypothetical protein